MEEMNLWKGFKTPWITKGPAITCLSTSQNRAEKALEIPTEKNPGFKMIHENTSQTDTLHPYYSWKIGNPQNLNSSSPAMFTNPTSHRDSQNVQARLVLHF